MPRLVLFDEPSEGLAPVIVEQLARTIGEIRAQGISVLLCEQNLRFAAHVADRAYIIEKGAIRFHGTMRELMTDEAVRMAYLTV